MTNKKEAYRRIYSSIVASSGTGTVVSDPIKRGRSLVTQSVTIINKTGARGTATLYLKAGAHKIILFNQASPSANFGYKFDHDQHLFEGEVLELSQASCTANDRLELHIVGYMTTVAPAGS